MAQEEQHMNYPPNLPPHSRKPHVERDDFAWFKKPFRAVVHKVLIIEQVYKEKTSDWWFKVVHDVSESPIDGIPDMVSEEWLFKIWQEKWGIYPGGNGPWFAKDGERY